MLGRFAVEAGALSPEALTAVLDERARASKPALFGVDLVARGLITEAQLKQAMARQISEVIYETLRWTQGQFSFRALPAESFPALARDAALGISVDGLLLEGFRRVDEWRVIEREIGDFDLVFVPNESRIAEVARGQLTRDEIAVLELVERQDAGQGHHPRAAPRLVRRLQDPVPPAAGEAHSPARRTDGRLASRAYPTRASRSRRPGATWPTAPRG